MDFDEFARGFRERTAARLVEFEKTLGKAQDEVEKAAQQAAKEAAGGGAMGASGKAREAEDRQTPPRRRTTGQVKSVLRRG